MTDLEIEFALADREARKHPAWGEFCAEMADVKYGREPLNQAWHFFKAGWKARGGWR